ncbi:MAG: hypothetical protein J5501_10370 [Ruminococcus sp.]|nr:hypothetical protein [Ruminococcus sp.]
MLTARQIKALRYYIGDVSGNQPFWSNGKAYVVLNALFFPGIAAEVSRAAEGKYLDPELLSDTLRLEELLRDLLSAFQSCTVSSPVKTFRVERMSDFSLCRSRKTTVSFTSTSTDGYLSSYSDRKGIALLEFLLHPGVPCIDVATELPHYAKPEEAEILLPPALCLDIEEAPLTEEHLAIKDSDGLPPQIRCVIRPSTILSPPERLERAVPEGSEAGMRVYEALNSGKRPSAEDITLYSNWKADFIANLFSV